MLKVMMNAHFDFTIGPPPIDRSVFYFGKHTVTLGKRIIDLPRTTLRTNFSPSSDCVVSMPTSYESRDPW